MDGARRLNREGRMLDRAGRLDKKKGKISEGTCWMVLIAAPLKICCGRLVPGVSCFRSRRSRKLPGPHLENFNTMIENDEYIAAGSQVTRRRLLPARTKLKRTSSKKI